MKINQRWLIFYTRRTPKKSLKQLEKENNRSLKKDKQRNILILKWHFLTNGKYNEIFSNKQIEKESDTYHDGFISHSFDTPYIEKIEPLTTYLRNPKKKVIELQLLFDFILNMNVRERLKAFDED